MGTHLVWGVVRFCPATGCCLAFGVAALLDGREPDAVSRPPGADRETGVQAF
jgi:hypothetical protein